MECGSCRQMVAVVTSTADRIGQRFLVKVTLGLELHAQAGFTVEAKRRAFQMEGSERAEVQRRRVPCECKGLGRWPGSPGGQDQKLGSTPGEWGRDQAHSLWGPGRKCPTSCRFQPGWSVRGERQWTEVFLRVLPPAWPPYKLASSLEGTPVGEQDGPPADPTAPFAPPAQGACLPED